jgi:hypothetical protein
MPTHNFKLYPFSQPNRLSEINITGTITRHGGTLTILFALSGSHDLTIIPETANKPARKNRLWEATCFEFFLKEKESDPYWEFNLSPTGHWNTYRFNCYRKGMSEETAFSELPFQVSRQTDALILDINLDLKKIIPPNLAVQANISTVIQSSNGEISFWSLIHPVAKPDFHHPDSFILEL